MPIFIMPIAIIAIIVFGGVVGISCYGIMFKNSTKMAEVIDRISDDQLVVDKLYGKDLSAWFKEKNPNNQYANVIIFPTEKNISQFHIPKSIKFNGGNQIVQILFDETTQKIILLRSVLFENLDAALHDMLEKNNGVIFIK